MLLCTWKLGSMRVYTHALSNDINTSFHCFNGIISNHSRPITTLQASFVLSWWLRRCCNLFRNGDTLKQGLHQCHPARVAFIILQKIIVFLHDVSGIAYSTQQQDLPNPQFWVLLWTSTVQNVGIPLFLLRANRMFSKNSFLVLQKTPTFSPL